MGVGNFGFGIGERFVGLVAEEGVEQVAGEQGLGGTGGLAFVLAHSESAECSTALDDAVVGGAVEGAQDALPAPDGGEGDGVGVDRFDTGGSRQDQGGAVDIGCDAFGGRRGGGGEEGGDGGDLALAGGEHRGARTHGVPGEGQAIRVHADVAVAESNAGADIQGGEQIGGETQM